jgi:hypothetical protein
VNATRANGGTWGQHLPYRGRAALLPASHGGGDRVADRLPGALSAAWTSTCRIAAKPRAPSRRQSRCGHSRDFRP